jgi:hypothetical protein
MQECVQPKEGCYGPLYGMKIQLQQIFLQVELNKRNTDDDYEKEYRTGQRGSREVLNNNEWLRAHQRITDRKPAKLMTSSLIGVSAFATFKWRNAVSTWGEYARSKSDGLGKQ